MKLKFVKDAVYDGKVVYSAGDVAEVDDSNGYASRWIKRGVAIDVVEEEVKVKKEESRKEESRKQRPVAQKQKQVELPKQPEQDKEIEL